ncbi:PC4/YdbC family ssDNA-binding protein [Candidatus Proelusimicrobium excrementi]|uniref:PC4/YdbC family ssDNA-binding protein n=1 Tax=Candidatus Proelusimicrobium excrementi TaxID=3416222 RepID=UPI003D11776D|nr:PC4/YdbC family ssDNA-binding protein [Elusimicrobiota bacterium]
MAESTFSVLNLIGALASEDGSEIKFSIDSYKGYKYVSIRKYLKSETYSGPTKAGITLSPEIVGKINTALAALPEDYKAVQEGELGKYAKKQGLSIVLRVSSYMGSKGIDLRQWQEDESYTGWTKKGIRLPIEKLKEVKELFAKTAKYFEENK